jgi:multicomponent Na+:H+ antiporter subunit D
MTGTLNMAEAALIFPYCQSYPKLLMTALFLAGLGTKAALAPFHAWLPDAHPSAPAPISAMLSGVLIKAVGIYAIIRIIYNVVGITYPISDMIVYMGALSIVWGSFLAIGQWDTKRMFACSSISQVGYIMAGLGLATPLGVMGGLFHLFNHALMKPLLFLSAGALEYSTGTRNMKELGGLREKMPVTSRASMTASMAISGIPPFNGFWSKLFIIVACVQANRIWLALIAVFGSIITLAYSLKFQKNTFFGDLPEAFKKTREVPATMLLSMSVFAILCLVCGLFFPFVIAFFINPALSVAASGTAYSHTILGGM